MATAVDGDAVVKPEKTYSDDFLKLCQKILFLKIAFGSFSKHKEESFFFKKNTFIGV